MSFLRQPTNHRDMAAATGCGAEKVHRDEDHKNPARGLNPSCAEGAARSNGTTLLPPRQRKPSSDFACGQIGDIGVTACPVLENIWSVKGAYPVLSWFRRRKYRKEVVTQMMAIHLLPDNRFQAFLQHYFPGSFEAIQDGFQRGQDATELAIVMSGAVMAKTIEALDEERRQRVLEEVVEWAQTPGAMQDLNGAVETARDGFAGRLRWGIAYVAKLELTHDLDDYFLEYFCTEIFGSLAGKTDEERSADRVGGMLEKLLDV